MKNTGQEFIEKTKYQYLKGSDQYAGYPSPPLEIEPKSTIKTVKLPGTSEFTPRQKDLIDAVNERRSVRSYTREPVSLEELSFLLWATQGVKEIVPGQATLRTVPSAGARHALETFLLINNVKGIEPGLYLYRALGHELALVSNDETIAGRITEACLGQSMVRLSACTFIWAADIYRMTWRYDERGYRYIFLDAGHACQNLYLCAQAVGCGACAVAAFHDDDLNAALGIDGDRVFAIYLATVGRV